MNESNISTPRTDDEIRHFDYESSSGYINHIEYVDSNFARQLERELTEARQIAKELAKARQNDIERLTAQNQHLREALLKICKTNCNHGDTAFSTEQMFHRIAATALY